MARRLHKNPSPEEQFRELVMDPDPAAMKIAEDLVMQRKLSLAELSADWERDEQLMPWRESQPGGVFILSHGRIMDRVEPKYLGTWLGWVVESMHRKFEVVFDFAFNGDKIDDVINHVTYYKSKQAMIRQAAADAWVMAKALKKMEHDARRGDVHLVPAVVKQGLINALFANDKTPPALFGGRRDHKKWGNFDVPTGRRRMINRNPGELPTVQAEYEALIIRGMARVLWVNAYGAWAQQIPVRDAADSYMVDASGMMVPWKPQVVDYMEASPPTPHAADTAARALAGVIVKNEQVGSLVDLFAIAVEIDTGAPFEYQPLAPLKTFTVRSPDGVRKYQATDQTHAREQHLDAFPDDMTQALVIREVITRPEPEFFTEFANRFVEGIRREMVTGVSAETWETLDAGDTPENEWYWEAWEELLRDAVITDADGQVWSVTQSENGIFLIPDGMEWSDEDDWYVWPEAATDDELPLAEEFGQALAHMCLDDSQSWFEGHKQRSESGNMEWAPELPGAEISYDGEQLTWRIVHGSPAGPDTRGKEFTERRVRITFESVTPGEEDDDEPTVENGWQDDDEEGVLMEPNDVTIAEHTADYIRAFGSVEASSSTFHTGVWYTQIDGRVDYQTGEHRTLSFHLYGYTPDEEREVFEDLTRRRR